MAAPTGVEQPGQPVAREIEVAQDQLERLLALDDRLEVVDQAQDLESGVALPGVRHVAVGDHAAHTAVAKLRQVGHEGHDPLARVGPTDQHDGASAVVAVDAGQDPVVGGPAGEGQGRRQHDREDRREVVEGEPFGSAATTRMAIAMSDARARRRTL